MPVIGWTFHPEAAGQRTQWGMEVRANLLYETDAGLEAVELARVHHLGRWFHYNRGIKSSTIFRILASESKVTQYTRRTTWFKGWEAPS